MIYFIVFFCCVLFFEIAHCGINTHNDCSLDICHIENNQSDPCTKCFCTNGDNCLCVEDAFLLTYGKKRMYRSVTLSGSNWEKICVQYYTKGEYVISSEEEIYREVLDDENLQLYKNFSKYKTIPGFDGIGKNNKGYICRTVDSSTVGFNFIIRISSNRSSSYSGCIGIKGDHVNDTQNFILIVVLFIIFLIIMIIIIVGIKN
jgi:hypothetical protein